MKLLVIGGGDFLGPAVVASALDAGYEVTTLTRSGRGVPPDAESLRGDRATTSGLSVLEGRQWDGVVDTCGYVPRDVAASARLLADSAEHYVFVSSISAYRDWPQDPVRPDSPTFECGSDAGPDDGHYGELKAGCERGVEEHFAGRCTIARAGHIVGPRDKVGRLPWWIQRVARGGEVLAPAPPERSLSMVDVRDLAAWLVHCGQSRVSGAMPVTGPPGQTSFGELLDIAREVTGAAASFVWVDDDFLVEEGVEPWQDLPYWIPARQAPGLDDVDTSTAIATGLRCRPVAETVSDTWRWLCEVGAPTQRADRPTPGIELDREQAVLNARHATQIETRHAR
jgi:2'-hydroxyisoflavone reductase